MQWVQDYEILQRDILKIGRVKFAVKEIGYTDANKALQKQNVVNQEQGHSANSIHTDTKDEEFEEFTEVQAIFKQTEEEGEKNGTRCRFCWVSEADEQNPLLGTCKCKGGLGQIHFQCLLAWLNIRR